jgi:hypothetical protein
MDTLSTALAVLVVYRVLVIPIVRGTLGMLNDGLDLIERVQRLTGGPTPPFTPPRLPQRACDGDLQARAGWRSIRAGR